jgi:hypothetical protein
VQCHDQEAGSTAEARLAPTRQTNYHNGPTLVELETVGSDVVKIKTASTKKSTSASAIPMRRTPKPPTRIRSVAGGKSGSSASFRAQSSALIRPEPDETFGDMVARALDISRRQSEILPEKVADGRRTRKNPLPANYQTGRKSLAVRRQVAPMTGPLAVVRGL